MLSLSFYLYDELNNYYFYFENIVLDYYVNYFVDDDFYICLKKDMMLYLFYVMNLMQDQLKDEVEKDVDMNDEILLIIYYK